jgi:hypothetical protein
VPGQIPLQTRYYPGDFQFTSWATHEPKHSHYPLFFTDRNLVVDSAAIFLEDSVNHNINVKLVKVPLFAVPNYGTPITGQQDLTSEVAFTTSGTYPVRVETGVTAGFTVNTAHNMLVAPSGLWILASGNFSGVAGNLHVQVRWRSSF